MSDVITSILTDASMRSDSGVQQALISQTEVGGGWLSALPLP